MCSVFLTRWSFLLPVKILALYCHLDCTKIEPFIFWNVCRNPNSGLAYSPFGCFNISWLLRGSSYGESCSWCSWGAKPLIFIRVFLFSCRWEDLFTTLYGADKCLWRRYLEAYREEWTGIPIQYVHELSLVLLVGSKYCTCTPLKHSQHCRSVSFVARSVKILKLSWNKCSEAVCLECGTNPLPISFYFAFCWCSLLSTPRYSKHAFLGNANSSNKVSLLPWTCARCFSCQLHSLFFFRKSLPCWLSSFFTHLSFSLVQGTSIILEGKRKRVNTDNRLQGPTAQTAAMNCLCFVASFIAGLVL